MASNLVRAYREEEYIVIEPRFLSKSSNLFAPPPQNEEIVFQKGKESSASNADELFSNGKPLPLNLPPRPPNATFDCVKSQSYRNICPLESPRVISMEANKPKYLFQWSIEIDEMVGDPRKKSCSKNLKQTKQFLLGEKPKASWAYIKYFLCKSSCFDKLCVSVANKEGALKKSSCKGFQNKCMKDENDTKSSFEFFYDDKNQKPCAVIKTINNEMIEYNFIDYCKRSFSGVIQRHRTSKASTLSTSSSRSSSLSINSIGFVHKRSISENYEKECLIEEAITYCKQSQM